MDPPYVVRKTIQLKPFVKYEYYQISPSDQNQIAYASPRTSPRKRSISDSNNDFDNKFSLNCDDNLKKRRIMNLKKLHFLKKINVPPTYTKVVLSLNPNSTLQGVGYDGTGHKQYFYSKKIIQSRSKDKYCSLISLGSYLKKIQKDIDNLLGSNKITNAVLNALALKIMFICNFRIGHPKNVTNYHTYGVTTINGQHLTLKKSEAWIKFVGKKKQWNLCLIEDKQLLQFLRRLARSHRQLDKKWPHASDKTLFTWNDYTVTPKSLNAFLANYHPDITSKTWRTWFANVEYIRRISAIELHDQITYRKRASNSIIRSIAKDLHHSPAICKRNYLINDLTKLYTDHPKKWQNFLFAPKSSPEAILIKFLKSYCRA